MKHHLYNCFRRGDVIVQHPFLRHANSAHAVKTNTVSKLSIEKIGARLFFYKLRIARDEVLEHVMPQCILRGIFICSFVKQNLPLHLIHPCCGRGNRGEVSAISIRAEHPCHKLEELKLFVENLTCDCSFITHHTISGVNLSGPNFLGRKDKIVAVLEHQISYGDLDRMAAFRRNKRTL